MIDSADERGCADNGEVLRPTTKKEFWDSVFARELQNFREFGDDGEVWFGSSSVARIVKWLREQKVSGSARILDIGCGNGNTLFALAKAGFTSLYGIDYIEAAITLCESMAAEQEITLGLSVLDILAEEADVKLLAAFADDANDSLNSEPNAGARLFDVLIDKGTYDVVSMRDVQSRASYVRFVKNIMKPNGVLILTTCNWTETEVTEHFSDVLRIDEVLPTSATFTFGGVQGRTNTACVLRLCNLIRS